MPVAPCLIKWNMQLNAFSFLKMKRAYKHEYVKISRKRIPFNVVTSYILGTAVPNIGHAQGRPPFAGIKRNIKKHFHVEYARKNLNVNRSP